MIRAMGLPIPTPFDLLSPTDLDVIEANADDILRTIGVELQDDPESLEAIASIGARVDSERVFTDAATLRKMIEKAPPTFQWQGPKGQTGIQVGGSGQAVISPTFGPPRVKLPDGTIRMATIEDYRQLVEICDESAVMDSTGFLLCIPHENGAMVGHMEMAAAHIELSDKPMMGTIISEEALREVACAVGVTRPNPPCRLIHMINLTPPLVCQPNPLRCLRASAQLGQATGVWSYMMMGATAPVTLAGAFAQGLAEVMVGLALTQIYNPGAPVVGGIFATPFSMQFMGPTFGTPESHIAHIAGCQLIRRLGIPTRGDGMLSSSKLNDAQAGYEGASALGGSLLGGADLILHGAGWSEFGRLYDIEKLISDCGLMSGR
ncbi:MAG: trimethylamine methyltransferase family protein [Pseudomonadota bacterium]